MVLQLLPGAHSVSVPFFGVLCKVCLRTPCRPKPACKCRLRLLEEIQAARDAAGMGSLASHPSTPMMVIYLGFCLAKVMTGDLPQPFRVQSFNEGESWITPRILCGGLRNQLNREMDCQVCSVCLGCLSSTSVSNPKCLIYSLAKNSLGA